MPRIHLMIDCGCAIVEDDGKGLWLLAPPFERGLLITKKADLINDWSFALHGPLSEWKMKKWEDMIQFFKQTADRYLHKIFRTIYSDPEKQALLAQVRNLDKISAEKAFQFIFNTLIPREETLLVYMMLSAIAENRHFIDYNAAIKILNFVLEKLIPEKKLDMTFILLTVVANSAIAKSAETVTYQMNLVWKKLFSEILKAKAAEISGLEFIVRKTKLT